MEKKEYLTEENYKKGKKIILLIAFLILMCGVIAGGYLILSSMPSKTTPTENKDSLSSEKEKLIAKKNELESKGIVYDKFAEYTDGEKYDLKIITDVLNPSFDDCDFDEYENNQYTSKYCSLYNEKNNEKYDTDFGFINPKSLIGIFIIVSSIMISLWLFILAKRREITAFTVQQTMPIAQEGIEKMTPTVANSVGTIAGSVAKGIKSGINEANQESTNNNNNE